MHPQSVKSFRKTVSRYAEGITKEATAIVCCGMPLCIVVLVNIMMQLYDAYLNGVSGAYFVYLPYLDCVFSSVIVVFFGAVLADITVREMKIKRGS